MRVVDQLILLLQAALDLVQRGLAAIIQFTRVIWEWTVTQILAVPWNQLDDLPLWKIIVLILSAIAAGRQLYFAALILIEAGDKALTHFLGFLSAIIKTILPILFAGALAAGGAWVINNVNFDMDHFNQRWR